jgi:acyl-CoA synthetase (AMP-forming)/AMP-acid ligase II
MAVSRRGCQRSIADRASRRPKRRRVIGRLVDAVNTVRVVPRIDLEPEPTYVLVYSGPDGYVYITDRLRDMITSGGFNIFPFEIEQVLLAHPAEQDCAVIGVPDPKWGEAVKACVQLKSGETASEEDLIGACKSSLGSMKAPKSIDFLDDLPRSPVGKVLKRELRAPYWAGRDRQVN